MKSKLAVRAILAKIGLSIFLLSENAYAIRINGQEVVMSEGTGEIVYEVEDHITNIVFNIKGDDISIGTLSETNKLKEQAISRHTSYNDQIDLFQKTVSGKFIEISAQSIITNCAYFQAEEHWNYKAKQSIKIDNSLAVIKGQTIFTSSALKAENFFITTPKNVILNGNENKKSWLSGIEISAQKGLGIPFTFFFQGQINFDSPSTDGHFMIVGAKSVHFNLRKL